VFLAWFVQEDRTPGDGALIFSPKANRRRDSDEMPAIETMGKPENGLGRWPMVSVFFPCRFAGNLIYTIEV